MFAPPALLPERVPDCSRYTRLVPKDAASGRPRRPDGPRTGRPPTDRSAKAAPPSRGAPGRGAGRPAGARPRPPRASRDERPGRGDDRPTHGSSARRPDRGRSEGPASGPRREGRDGERPGARRGRSEGDARPAARTRHVDVDPRRTPRRGAPGQARSGPRPDTWSGARADSAWPRRVDGDTRRSSGACRPDGDTTRSERPRRPEAGGGRSSRPAARPASARRPEPDSRARRPRPGADSARPTSARTARPAPTQRSKPDRPVADRPRAARPTDRRPATDRRPTTDRRPATDRRSTERKQTERRPADGKPTERRPADRRPTPTPLPGAGRGWGSVARKGARAAHRGRVSTGPTTSARRRVRTVAIRARSGPRRSGCSTASANDAPEHGARPSRSGSARRPDRSATTDRRPSPTSRQEPTRPSPQRSSTRSPAPWGAPEAGKVADRLAAAARAYERDRYPEALRITRELVDQVPESAAARELHGLVCYRLGRWREAVKHLEAARTLSGGDPSQVPMHHGLPPRPGTPPPGRKSCGTSCAPRRRRPTSSSRAVWSWPRTWPRSGSSTRPSWCSPPQGRPATSATPATATSGSGTSWPICTSGPATSPWRGSCSPAWRRSTPSWPTSTERLLALGVPRRRQRRGAAGGRR